MVTTCLTRRRGARLVSRLACLGFLLQAGGAVAQPLDTGKQTFFDDFSAFANSPVGLIDGKPAWKTTFNKSGPYMRSLPSNGEREYYTDKSVGRDPFVKQADGLHIIAQPGPNADNLPYTSGLLTTYTTFHQLYGYFEIKAKLPAGKGLWPAFWLLPMDRTWPPELDVLEMLGDRPSRLYFTAHTQFKEANRNTGVSHVADAEDTSVAFHRYGVNWTADQLTWFIDGKQVATEPTPRDMHKPMFLLVNLAVGGHWPGVPDESTRFPAQMVVAWVKATRGTSEAGAE